MKCRKCLRFRTMCLSRWLPQFNTEHWQKKQQMHFTSYLIRKNRSKHMFLMVWFWLLVTFSIYLFLVFINYYYMCLFKVGLVVLNLLTTCSLFFVEHSSCFANSRDATQHFFSLCSFYMVFDVSFYSILVVHCYYSSCNQGILFLKMTISLLSLLSTKDIVLI